MHKNFTPEEMLQITQPLRSKGWSIMYVKLENMFKVSKRDYHMMMEPSVFQDIFIERTSAHPVRRGITKDKHPYKMADIKVGQAMNIDGEYFAVVGVGCAMAPANGQVEARRDWAVLAHICIEDIVFCNMELHPSPNGIDATLYFPGKVQVKLSLN